MTTSPIPAERSTAIPEWIIDHRKNAEFLSDDKSHRYCMDIDTLISMIDVRDAALKEAKNALENILTYCPHPYAQEKSFQALNRIKDKNLFWKCNCPEFNRHSIDYKKCETCNDSYSPPASSIPTSLPY